MMIAQIVQKLFGPLPAGLAKDAAAMPPAPGAGDFGVLMQAAAADLPAEITIDIDEALAAPLFELGLMVPAPAPPAPHAAPAAELGNVDQPTPLPSAAIGVPLWAVASAPPPGQPPLAPPPPVADAPPPVFALPPSPGAAAPPEPAQPIAALMALPPPASAGNTAGTPLVEPAPAPLPIQFPLPLQVAPAPSAPLAINDLPNLGADLPAQAVALPQAKQPHAPKPPLAAPRLTTPDAAPDSPMALALPSARPDAPAPTPAASAGQPAAAAMQGVVGPVVGPLATAPIPAPTLWTIAQTAAAPVMQPVDPASDTVDVAAPLGSEPENLPILAPGPAGPQHRQAAHVQAFERYLFEQRSDMALADLPAVAATPQSDGRSGAPSIGPAPVASALPAPSQPLAAQILPHAAAAQSGPVEVLLSPQELGHLRFEIQHRVEGVQILLSAERLDTMDLLRRNGDQLLADFRQAGFAGASLSFGQWGGASPGQGQAEAALRDDLAPLAADAPSLAPPAPFIPPRAYTDPSRALNLRL